MRRYLKGGSYYSMGSRTFAVVLQRVSEYYLNGLQSTPVHIVHHRRDKNRARLHLQLSQFDFRAFYRAGITSHVEVGTTANL